jgi:hypothetical protein
MMIRKLFFCCILSFFPLFTFADKIVVWNLKPQAGVTDKEAATVSSIVTSEIARVSKNTIISESEMRSVIDGEQMKMSCGAEDSSCIAEIGAAMGAPLSVSGTFSKMGDYWIITLQLVDVRKVEVQSRVSKRFKGGENTLVEAITPLICELFNDKECMEKSVQQIKDEKKSEKKEKKPVSWKKVTGWVLTVPGILTFGSGIAAHVLMKNAKEDYEQTGEDEGRYKSFRTYSTVGYVAGSVLMAGGIALLIWDGVEKSKKNKKNEAVSFYVVPSFDGAYAGMQWSW